MKLKDKKILVTGGAGFLGNFVVDRLRKHEQVPEKNIFIPRSKNYDLRKLKDIKKLFNDFPADIIIHLAANVGGIGYNKENPGTLFYDNLIMGTQLLEQARLNKLEKFVAIGTVCSYPKFTSVPFKETNLWEGYPEETNAPYGLAKRMMLAQSQAYKQQYGFNSIFLLPVNLYGPRDNFGKRAHVIPDLIEKFAKAKKDKDKEVVLWGDGTPTREFLYVEDAAIGIILATKLYNKSGPVNIGIGAEISIKNLAKKIQDLIGFEGRIRWDTSKPNGQPRRCLDVSKAKEEFGFEAKTTLEEGLRKTIEGYFKDY